MWSGGGLQLDLKGLFTRFVDLGVTSQSFWQDGGGGEGGGCSRLHGTINPIFRPNYANFLMLKLIHNLLLGLQNVFVQKVLQCTVFL